MDYRKQIEKLTSQLKFWKIMIIAGAIVGGILFFFAVYFEMAGVAEDNEGLYLIGNVFALFAGIPFDIMIAGIILNVVWNRRIASRMRLLSQSVEQNPPKDDPLSDFTNKDDPFH